MSLLKSLYEGVRRIFLGSRQVDPDDYSPGFTKKGPSTPDDSGRHHHTKPPPPMQSGGSW